MKFKISLLSMLTLSWITVLATPTPLLDDITAVTHGEEAADGLDLQAVVQVLKDVKDAEALERALNDPELGLNNLDLNEDGQVDYIRVVTEQEGDTHVIILQVPLEEHEVQDIATIEVEKDAHGEIAMQVHGSVHVYGPDYYVRPVGVHFSVFPFISWLYSPIYRPWRPHYYIGYYPTWYRPWRTVSYSVYRPRITRYNTVRVGVYRKSVVVRAPRIYKPRATVVVKKPLRRPVTINKTTNISVKPKTTTVKRTTTVKKTTPVHRTIPKTKRVTKTTKVTTPKTTVTKTSTVKTRTKPIAKPAPKTTKKVTKKTKTTKTKNGKKTVVKKKKTVKKSD